MCEAAADELTPATVRELDRAHEHQCVQFYGMILKNRSELLLCFRDFPLLVRRGDFV